MHINNATVYGPQIIWIYISYAIYDIYTFNMSIELNKFDMSRFIEPGIKYGNKCCLEMLLLAENACVFTQAYHNYSILLA